MRGNASTVIEFFDSFKFSLLSVKHLVELIVKMKSRKVLFESETTSIWWLPVFILPWIGLFLLVLLNYHALPVPLMIENEVYVRSSHLFFKF